jgi:hypothetical protein
MPVVSLKTSGMTQSVSKTWQALKVIRSPDAPGLRASWQLQLQTVCTAHLRASALTGHHWALNCLVYLLSDACPEHYTVQGGCSAQWWLPVCNLLVTHPPMRQTSVAGWVPAHGDAAGCESS